MGKLVRFTFADPPPPPPPAEPMKRAEWLHDVLARELYDALCEPPLSPAARRDTVQRYATKLVQATPNHELYNARESLRGEEAQLKSTKLRGGVSSSSAAGSEGHLRASAPRGRTRPS